MSSISSVYVVHVICVVCVWHIYMRMCVWLVCGVCDFVTCTFMSCAECLCVGYYVVCTRVVYVICVQCAGGFCVVCMYVVFTLCGLCNLFSMYVVHSVCIMSVASCLWHIW